MHKFWITLSKRFAKQRWLSIGNGQENPRRASRLTASLLPILQSIDADAHKLCKCTLTYTKLLSQKLHILIGLHSTTSFNRPHARRPLGATQNLSSILHAFKKLSKIFLIHVCMPPQSCQLPFSVLRSSSLFRFSCRHISSIFCHQNPNSKSNETHLACRDQIPTNESS